MTWNLCCDEQLPALLKRFWKYEKVSLPPLISITDQICKRLFVEGCQRTNSGRYVVRLPKQSEFPTNLEDSLTRTKRVLGSMQKRMENDIALKSEYTCFMSEYETRGHMRHIKSSDRCDSTDKASPINYIPHHAIWRDAVGKL